MAVEHIFHRQELSMVVLVEGTLMTLVPINLVVVEVVHLVEVETEAFNTRENNIKLFFINVT